MSSTTHGCKLPRSKARQGATCTGQKLVTFASVIFAGLSCQTASLPLVFLTQPLQAGISAPICSCRFSCSLKHVVALFAAALKLLVIVIWSKGSLLLQFALTMNRVSWVWAWHRVRASRGDFAGHTPKSSIYRSQTLPGVGLAGLGGRRPSARIRPLQGLSLCIRAHV